jgi:hypothetical protein
MMRRRWKERESHLDEHGLHDGRAVHVLLEVLVKELEDKVQVVLGMHDLNQAAERETGQSETSMRTSRLGGG